MVLLSNSTFNAEKNYSKVVITSNNDTNNLMLTK